MIDEANERSVFDSSVVAVQPIAAGMARQINEQNGLYT